MVKTRSGDNNSRTSAVSNRKGKARNKVSSPVPKRVAVTRVVNEDVEPTSDEYNYSDEEDDCSTAPSRPASNSIGSAVNYSSDNSGKSVSREKLPFNIQKALVFDIQSSGGIVVFALIGQEGVQAVASLCDKRKDTFGRRGDPLREKIRKKVWAWSKNYLKDPKSWGKVLAKFECTEKSAKVEVALKKKLESDIELAAVHRSPVPISFIPSTVATRTAREYLGQDNMENSKCQRRVLSPTNVW
jgi:hypothetical protein